MKKRLSFVVAVALLALATVAAQGMPGYGPAPAPAPDGSAPGVAPTLVKVEGKLSLVNGHVAVVAAGKTWYVMIPPFLFGFIDGLKEGAQVKLEGYEQPVPMAPGYSFLRVTKLAVGGKEYDLSAWANGGFGPGMGGGTGPGSGRGRR